MAAISDSDAFVSSLGSGGEYADLYSGTYSTAGAQDAVMSLRLVPQTDNITATDAVKGLTPNQITAQSADTATAAEAGSLASVHQSSADTATASEGNLPTPNGKLDTDTGAAAEAVTRLALSDGDTTNAAEVDQLLDVDAAVAADTASIALSDTDAGTSTDTVPANQPRDSDAAISVEIIAQPIALASSDANAATVEATGFLPALPISDTETAHSSEAVTVLLPAFSDSDAATGSEAVTVLKGRPADSDAATGSDLNTVLAGKSDTDVVVAAESQTAARLDTDTGHGTENTGTVKPTDSDGAVAAENSRFPSAPSDEDTAHATEAASPPPARLSSSDQASGFETANAFSTALVFGNAESFSISRAAVLAGGVESGQLYGVRGGTLSPTFTTHDGTADDQVILEWNDQISYVAVTITAGFIPFATLSAVLGGVFSSTATSGAVGYGVLSMSNDFSLVLRMNGKSFLGAPRTMDIVLYRCNFQRLVINENYKDGVNADYSVFAVLSSVDEAGNSLATQEVGRLVSSPGSLSGPVGVLFGRGT